MNFRRPRREVEQLAHKALEEEGAKTFGELHKYVEQNSPSGKCSDKVLFTSLINLKPRVESVVIDGRKKWRFTKSYLNQKLKDDIINAAKNTKTISHGAFHLAPTFLLNDDEVQEKSAGNIYGEEKLDEAAQAQTWSEIHGLMYALKNERIILDFAARCLWLGNAVIECGAETPKMLEEFKGDWPESLESILKSSITQGDHYGTLFDDLAAEMILGMEWALSDLKPGTKTNDYDGMKQKINGKVPRRISLPDYLTRFMAISLAKELATGIASPSIFICGELEKTLEKLNMNYNLMFSEGVFDPDGKKTEIFNLLKPKLKIIDESWEKWMKANVENIGGWVAYNIVKNVPNDFDENLKWLIAHRGEFKKFLEHISKTKFIQIIMVGHEKETGWPFEPYTIEAVDHLLKNLKKCTYGDGKSGWGNRIIHFEDVENVADKIVRRFLSTRGQEKPCEIKLGRREKYSFHYLSGGAALTPARIYEYYPGAKKLEFWQKMKELAEQTIKNQDKFTRSKASPRAVQ
jgi:hypothetical protein